MSKQKTIYICQNCGFELPKWSGKCPECHKWNTITEEIVKKKSCKKKATIKHAPSTLDNIKPSKYGRIKTEIKEIDRVLGGGIVEGAVVLIGGEPGVGKTTLLYQLMGEVTTGEYQGLYISGEESSQQAKIRTTRLEIPSSNIYLVSETDLGVIKAHIDKVSPKIVVVDSIQVISSGKYDSSPGTISQVREVANQLITIGKERGITIFLVGHITKGGTFAGPKLLEHMVDTVLYFEGERYSNYRVLRCVKNRFGSTEEIGIFDMSSQGLKEVGNPSKLFITERPEDTSGSVIVPVREGTRAILVEIQALVSEASFGNPIRRTSGIDYNRVSLLIAVLEKRAGLMLRGMDVFVKVTGGMKLSEPATDLAASIAIASSFKDRVVESNVVVLGEVGLGGEIRTVTNVRKRIKEAAKVGFNRCVLPSNYKNSLQEIKDIKLNYVKNINQAMELLIG